MNKVIVTGGAGFIGRHLVATLLKQGSQVTVFDNNYEAVRAMAFNRPPNDKQLRLVHGDIRDLASVKTIMKGHDLVWHLAANTDIPNGHKDTSLDMEHCTRGTWNVLEAMVANGVRDILFASTAAIYGTGGADAPLTEGYGPITPISLYAAGKLSCEGYISAYCHLFGLRAAMFRFGNVVGAGMSHGVIFDLIQKLKKNPERLEVWGDGKGMKPFFLVEDCIRGMLVAYHHRAVERHAPPAEIFNLGCDTTTTIADVADIVVEKMGLSGKCRIEFTGAAQGFPGDVPVVRYSAEKMASLGWRPQCTSTAAVIIATERLVG